VREISTSAEKVKKTSDELRFSLFLKMNILQEKNLSISDEISHFITSDEIELFPHWWRNSCSRQDIKTKIFVIYVKLPYLFIF
jgi:hypothetical protein